MPVLTIIAGPNGAGKSTHSKDFVAHSGIEAFDFDKEFLSLWSQFSFDPVIEQGAFDRAQQLYLERRTEAIKSHLDFALETNYHTSEILAVVELFKVKGYRLELIYICLEYVSVAIERVKERVVKGGHYVSEDVIRDRFEKGLDLLNKSFTIYDNVSIYLSEWKEVKPLLNIDISLNSLTLYNPIPEPLRLRLKNLTEFISNNIT